MVKDGWKPNVIVSFVARHTVFCILATVILVETLLFVGYHRNAGSKPFNPWERFKPRRGKASLSGAMAWDIMPGFGLC
jgi:hypothetical protein